MPVPLLQTKLHIPYDQSDSLIARPRLHELLSLGLERKLTLAAAPAGFGKTALICQWLREEERHVAWFSVDEGDRDLTQFLRYMVVALHQTYPDIGRELVQIIEEADLSHPEPFLAELIHSVETAMADQPTQKAILVLDDYHLVSNESIHQALRYLLEHLPRSLHLILTTRSDPPFPLARMRVRQELNEIRSDALRFSPDELKTFFDPISQIPLTPALLDQLSSRTEGWIAGMQLAGLTLQDLDAAQAEQFITALAGTDRYISDYLLDEVLLRQSDDVREFLLQTSILERLSPGLCDALTQQKNGHQLLRQLEAGNFFLIGLGHAQEWYRYHHLFLDLLRTQVHYQYPEKIEELHRRACGWYATNDFISDALHHAFAAKDEALAAKLIEQHAFAFVLRGNLQQPLAWLKQLPDDAIVQSPPLSLTYAWIMSFTSEVERIEPMLQNAEAHIESVDPALQPSFRLQIGLLRAFSMIHGGEPEQGLADGERLLELIPQRETRLRGTALLMLAEGHNVAGRIVEIHRVLAESVPLFQKSDAYTLSMIAASGLILCKIILGDLRSAEQTCQKMLNWAAEEGLEKLPATSAVMVNLGEIYREQNRLDEAERYLADGLRLVELSGFSPAGSDGYWSLGQLRRGQGKWDEAQTAFERALSIRPGDYGPSTVAINTQKVRLWIEMGALHLAEEWAKNSELSLADSPTMVHDLEYIMLCRVAMAVGETQDALTMLHKLEKAAIDGGRMARVIEVFVLQAIAYNAAGQTKEALDALRKAIQIAKPEGYIRTIVDEGAAIVPLLRRAATQGIEPEYVASLLAILQTESPEVELEQPLIEPLSERELELLALVADGLSNKQISEQLIISMGTTKKHMSNILGKLSASNRTEAVRRAQDLNII